MAVVTVRWGYPDDFGDRYDAIERAYTEAEWDHWRSFPSGGTSPHCDGDILHAPGECAVCDLYPLTQRNRMRSRVAFTGHAPLYDEVPCPADQRRPGGTGSWHGEWGGNRPQRARPVAPAQIVPVSPSIRDRIRAAFGGILRR